MEALQQQTAVPIFEIRNLDLFYGQVQALKHIDMDILQNKITALIGPSGCGKSTFLRTLNRMNDLIEGVRVTGEIKFEGKDLFTSYADRKSVV